MKIQNPPFLKYKTDTVRVISTEVDKIPDGGLDAWLVAIGSMIVMMQTWGLTNSFGVFQTFYENEFLPDHSSSDISWIGSLQGALLLMGTAVSGPLFDRGHFRALLIGGNAVVLSGLFSEYMHIT